MKVPLYMLSNLPERHHTNTSIHRSLWLQGQVSPQQPIRNLLQYFISSQARGYLELLNPIHGKVEVYFDSGKVRHCSLASLEGEEALKEALHLRRGDFQVWRDVPAPKRSIYRGLDSILLDAHIEDEQILNLQSLVQASANAMDETISISLQDITVLRHLHTLRPLGEVAHELQIEDKKLINVAERLLARGLIRYEKPKERYFPASFFPELQHLCANFLGPMSGVVLEEALDNLGCRAESILTKQHRMLAKLLLEHLPAMQQQKFMQQYNQLLQHYRRKPSL